MQTRIDKIFSLERKIEHLKLTIIRCEKDIKSFESQVKIIKKSIEDYPVRINQEI
jgi:chaperonin cofactor prefoldin